MIVTKVMLSVLTEKAKVSPGLSRVWILYFQRRMGIGGQSRQFHRLERNEVYLRYVSPAIRKFD